MKIDQRILFVGVGQAGGNIVNLFEKKGYLCTYINTSNEDLKTIDTDEQNKFHIPMATGCSKKRDRALLYVKKHCKKIIEHIEGKYPNQDIVFFVFSAGGGTGAGMSPSLLTVFSEMNEHKNYGAIMAMPSTDESIRAIKNACATYSEVTNIAGLKSVFVLDNVKDDKLAINRKFVNLFDRFLNITVPNKKGIIDLNEMETLLTEKGVTVLLSTEEQEDKTVLRNSVFVDFEKGCTSVGISCSNDSDVEYIQYLIEDLVGCPEDYFIGYNDDSDVIAITGLSYPIEIMEEFLNSVNDKNSTRENRGGAVAIKNPFADEEKRNKFVAEQTKPIKQEKTKDIKSILDRFS